MAEPAYEKPPKLNRRQYYTEMADELVRCNGLLFDGFLERNPGLLRLGATGDDLISARKTTGYNLTANPKDMDILSDRKLLFFNIYCGDTTEAGKLIAHLEERGLIAETQVKLGVKASKVLYGNWTQSTNEVVERLFPDNPDNLYNPVISKTLDTVITFMPVSGYHARQIFDNIRGLSMWDYPDLRATISLKTHLPRETFTPVQANILTAENQELVVLRRRTKFVRPWVSRWILVNKELDEYLTKYEVEP